MSLANRKVLVLNKSWQAISVVSLEKALKKVAGTYSDGTPKAKIIDCVNDFRSFTWQDWTELKPEINESCMKGVSCILRIPEVIQYTRYDKVPKKKVHYNRRTIYKRDNNTCQYCQKMKNSEELSLDHVVPKCQGGLTTWENIVVACTDCNSKKAGRTPKQAGMKLLRKPMKPKSNFFTGDIRIESWSQFLGENYWSIELENDNS
ncbi:MAG: HNH endonuclease [Neisseriaceae bacterium]|nr:MAG: HNH endonuclease [Neisseriaceae bacterium]